MDSFHKLVKEIDALTYNARTVLNALNRSVISSSSTSGFTIKRSGVTLTLTRPLIYRLSRFYEDWANNEFATTTNNINRGFDDILAAHDVVPVTDDKIPATTLITTPTSKALITHSKILYMNESNVSRNDDTSDNNQYWLDLIKNANNPKLITNSAPIPLNIRTPIFNENMSTTQFLTDESYLFPYGYFALDQLGYLGDGISHQLAGLSWEIKTDDYIRLIAPKVSIGNVDPNATLKTIDRREGIDSLSWGRDTHARGQASTAGGETTMALGDGSIAIGKLSLASDFVSIVLGYFNSTPGDYAIAAAGASNYAIGSYSAVIGGNGNIAGEEPLFFQFKSTVVTTPDNCAVDFVNCTAQFTNGGNTIIYNKNIIAIDGIISDRFFPGDTVKLFNFTTNVNGNAFTPFYYTDGDGFQSFLATVAGISYEFPTEDNPNIVQRTIVTLDREVPYANIDGGMISTLYKVTATPESSTSPGYGSFVTGLYNISTGEFQTVVGKYNKKHADALFIVGTGDSSVNRLNSLVVRSSEVLAYGVESSGGVLADDSYVININASQALVKGGLGYFKADNNSTYMKNGIFGSGNFDVSEIELISGSMRLFAGSSFDMQAQNFGSIYIANGGLSVGAQGINMYTTNSTDMYLSAENIVSYANHTIQLNWPTSRENVNFGGLVGGLRLSGQTYGALTANDNQYAHVCGDGSVYPQAAINTTVSNVSRTGFYQFYDNTGDPSDGSYFPDMSSIGGNSNKAWLLNISGKDLSVTDDEVYDAWQIAFGIRSGIDIDGEATFGNIAVRRARNSFGNTIPESNGQRTQWRYLAWNDDLVAVAANVTALQQYGLWQTFATTLGFDGGTAVFSSPYFVYTVIGKTLLVKIQVQWDSAVGLTGITFTLPFNVHPFHSSNKQPAIITKTFTDNAGQVYYAGLNQAYVRPNATGPLNASGEFGANLIYELP